MEAQQDALVNAIRAIIAPRDVARERILALLQQAGNDPNKAVDLYFQSEANANGAAELKANDVEGSDDEDGDGMAWAETPALPRKPLAVDDAEWTPKAEELSGLLGGDVKRDVILGLLRRTGNNLQKAVEVYFSENGADAEFDEGSDDEDEAATAAKTPLPPTPKSSARENGTELPPPPMSPAGSSRTVSPPSGAVKTPQTPAHSSAALPQTPSALTAIESHQLTPLVSPAAKDTSATGETEPAPAEKAHTEEELNGPGTYEVVMSSSNFRWQIGNVFGRAVVQHVQPGGPAALAGIQKADVLLSFRETVLNEENCAAVVQQLSKERVLVPSALRFRRAAELYTSQQSTPKPNGVPSSVPTTSPPQDGDGDVVMSSVDGEAAAKTPVEPKYGLQVLCQAMESMQDAVAGPSAVEFKVLVDLLLNSEFSLDRAVNTFLTEDRIVSDFRGIVGFDWDPEQPISTVMGANKPYAASIPAGPLGLTVENILERTIVVDIKSGGAAERANVKRSSWLVGLNGERVTHLTHKETLRLIETASRPLQLQLVIVPPDDYKALRRQLSMNIRQQKTERPIPEQDRMSFRVFQMKIHQGVLSFPKLVTKALFQYLSTEEYHPPTMDAQYPNPLERLLPANEAWDAALLDDIETMEEERAGEMCAERRFLLNLFASIHDYDDKGESTVIRTIQFLGWLAVRTARMQQFVDAKEPKSSSDGRTIRRYRYELLLAVVLHVLESLSIIENHATWDVMVNALKMLILSLTDEDVDKLLVPMFARLSVSSSPTARIVPVALLSMVYPHVRGDVRVQLRGMLDRMCNDDNPLVRRAVTSVIGDLAAAGGSPVASWTVQLLEKSTADSHDIVRIFAVKGCITLATTLRRLLLEDQNKSKEEADQVRLETARTLPAFCRAFGADYTDVFVDHFVSMVGDPTVEVRRACAEGSFLLGEALRDIALQQTGSSEESNSSIANSDASELVVAAQIKFVRSVLPATYALSTDVSVAVRLSLAQSVGRSLQFIGSNYYDELVPIFTQFLDESQDPTVRASLLEEMARYCDSSSDTVTAMIFPAIQALRTSVQWRVRVKFVHCVAAWAERDDGAPLPGDFADACLELLGDAVHEVRAVVCEKLPSLGKSLGSEWVAEKCVPRVSVCLQSTFHGRLTGLLAVELLAPELQQMEKLRDVIETVVEQYCRPFESDWSAFRCPTRCTLDQSSSLAVYGSSPYRADSRICRAAIHAGVIGPNGGCAFYRFAGAANAFYSSSENGVTTNEFLSWFPKTIEFKEGSSSYCSDLTWWILSVGFVATTGFGLIPRARPAVMFYSLVAWGFFYVRLVGQPSSQDYAGISIDSFGEVMILLAASSVAYRMAASKTFRGWKSLSLKRRILMWPICYVTPYHVMINMNLIGYVPWLNIDLGGFEEVNANAGTYVVFSIVGIGAALLAFTLFRNLYRGGTWKKCGVMYAAMITAVLVSWALFPSTSFHLHHTMLGAFIIPVTTSSIPAAAFSQAIALGCFVQGYARWGWSSYLDTIPTYMTIAVPRNAPNTTNVTSSGAVVVWEPLESVEAYSLRLNRVEVYRGLDTSAVISNLEPNITYFVGVAGVVSWGTNGGVGSLSNFTTLEN
ncbi:Protein phosphatase 2A regulatory subunit A [Phytophthora cinnamomi]|uniref:Protein phosphatase 2A regulatory subunit A n=1 Tax=Phytophthora cinnamomi TaxID=4785 RepID=UPI00355A033B|nr:Protein phosphatase 2A regulatory subunit A [Phytophthora cinnamomi]